MFLAVWGVYLCGGVVVVDGDGAGLGFEPFGLTHGVVTGLFLFALLVFGSVGVRLREGVHGDGLFGGHGLRRMEVAGGWFGVGVWVFLNAWYMQPSEFAWDESLPLHICDVVAIAGPLGLLTRSRLLMSLAWFWGVGLSSQGLVTPVLQVGLDDMRFYLFWANHWIAVGIGIWFVAVIGYRPRSRDFVAVLIVSLVWMLGLFLLGWIVGGNYGYVGKSLPDQPTVLDALGEWPIRAVNLVLIGVVVLIVMWLPFVIGRRLGCNWAMEPGERIAGA